MSTPKRRQHLSSSMTMLMTTATPAAMATATATAASAATASSAAWAKRRAAALVNTLPTRRDSPYPLPSLLFFLSFYQRDSPFLRRHPLAAMFWKMSVDFPIRYYLLSPSPVAVSRFSSACPFHLPSVRPFLSSRPAPADSHLLNEFDGRQAVNKRERASKREGERKR